MRVYLPVIWAELPDIAAGHWKCPDRVAVVAPSEDEEAEYEALEEAAERAAALPNAEGRRCVIVLDGVPDGISASPGGAVISGLVPLGRVASLHVAQADEDELSWYASQEIADLI